MQYKLCLLMHNVSAGQAPEYITYLPMQASDIPSIPRYLCVRPATKI